ncbi:MAG: tetratricopeptide repeat protein [Thermomonas sp.]|uniref:tetratricopeptide repeat protein n=1 Tax=Thermomonas sp. TaxID=1971895 RepID=UPI001D262343|nr:tetratricopeptide repeat protein [Thermomonas sp.]MBZ0088643.1 tetratricopeptide repeat protein [Thermomonas sp.]
MAGGFFAELKRRNVLRAAVLYIGAVWALAQGIAQLGPEIGAPEGATRWFLIAAGVGFPLWLMLSWRYELTGSGLKLESEITTADLATRKSHNRRTDLVIIAVLAVAVVLLLTDRVVEHVEPQAAAPAPALPVDSNSIAVLPFDSGSNDSGQQAFSDGLSEGFIIALAQIKGLRVINPKSSFQFRGSEDDDRTIAAKLGVSHLLEGTVRRLGDTVRVSATLIRASDGSTLWADSFDRPYKDLFALQDAITAQVAAALKAQLLPKPQATQQGDRPPSGNLDAYDAYVQARLVGVTDAGKALELYNRAITLDPDYGVAYAWKAFSLVDAVAGGGVTGKDAEKFLKDADIAAAQAIRLAPNQAAPHIARGWLLVTRDFNWKEGEAELRKAVELAPDDGDALYQLGVVRAGQGDLNQAIDLTRRALKINPLDANWYRGLAAYLMPSGRLDEARQAINKAIELEPKALYNHYLLAVIELLRKDPAASRKAAEAEPEGAWRDFALALAAQVGPDRPAADARVNALIRSYPEGWAMQIAQVYAVRGEPDAMFQWLDKARAARDPGMTLLHYDPLLLRYRDDPRYAALARKVGLPWPAATSAPVAATPAVAGAPAPRTTGPASP